MWSTILSLIPQVVSMFSSSNASDDYNKKLEQIKEQQRLSSSALQAKSLLGQNATRGLAGYETMKEDIYNTLPVTLNETRDFLSGAGVVDYLAKAKASTDQQLRQLNAANEQERNRNEQLYATYLGNTMAGYENTLQNNRNDLSLAQAGMDYNKAGTLTSQLGELAKGVGDVAQLDWRKVVAGLSNNDGGSTPTTSTQTFGDYNKQFPSPETEPLYRVPVRGIDPLGEVDPFDYQTGNVPSWLQVYLKNIGKK